MSCSQKPRPAILERCIFRHKSADVYLVADAYRGIEIKQAIWDFLDSAAGGGTESIAASGPNTGPPRLPIYGGAALVAYIGHDGLMDFQLPKFPPQRDGTHRDAILLACASKQFFADAIRAGGAYPLLWTTNLMAPEAYTLKAALDGWVAGENSEDIRDRAAAAYDKYQKCGARAARRLLADCSSQDGKQYEICSAFSAAFLSALCGKSKPPRSPREPVGFSHRLRHFPSNPRTGILKSVNEVTKRPDS